MRASVYLTACAVSVLTLSVPMLARAEVQQGAIDWQTRTIKCTGKAAPNPNAVTVAAARIGAERAAKMDAFRNILETLRGVKVEGSKTAADAMQDPGVSSSVKGKIKGFHVTDTRYFEDGGVEVDVEMPLDGLVSDLVPSDEKSGNATPAGAGATGIVVDAKGLKLSPALAPRIFDEAGKEVYGPKSVDLSKAQHGLASYVKDAAAAQKDARVGAQPTVVKAIALAQGSASDVVISNEDAKKARAANVSEGNVVFVVQ